MFDYVKLYGEDLAPILQPGEKVLSIVLLTQALGDTRVGEVVDESGFDFFPLEYHNTKWERAPWKLLGGTVLVSPEGGQAVYCHEAFSKPTSAVLTDRRFMAVEGVSDRKPEVQWQCERKDIAFLRRAPRGIFGRGRIAVGFTDKSYAVLIAGTITWHRANQITKAFNPLS